MLPSLNKDSANSSMSYVAVEGLPLWEGTMKAADSKD